MKHTAVIFFIFFSFYNVKTIQAQRLNRKSFDQRTVCGFAGTMPKPKKTFEELDNGFFKTIYPDTLEHRIYVKIYVDTLGTVKSTNFIKGSGNNRIDSLTTIYVKSLKFSPAFYTKDKKKTEMSLVIPFPINLYQKGN